MQHKEIGMSPQEFRWRIRFEDGSSCLVVADVLKKALWKVGELAPEQEVVELYRGDEVGLLKDRNPSDPIATGSSA